MERTGRSPQLLRRTNMSAVLAALRGAGTLTTSDLIAVTGLARATVIAVCDDLIRMGWVVEPEAQREGADSSVGRPARRFRFNDRAGCVVGLDVGVVKTTAVVADVTGTPLGRSTQRFDDEAPAGRRATVHRAVDRALEADGVSPATVLAVAVGVAAPVDRQGRISGRQSFWEAFDIGLDTDLEDRYGWPVLLANDANLAALAEHWQGVGAGVEDLAVMLSGERFGTGLIESGRLLRGSLGGAGEVGDLELVRGVGSPQGIATLCRIWGAEALAPGAPATMLRDLVQRPQDVGPEAVFRAAAAGDEVARSILDRIADRMARIIALLATFFNPRLLVIAGAVAEPAAVLVGPIRERLPRYTATPPEVAVSTLGEAVVSLGAVRMALDHVEQHALDLELHPRGGAERLTAP
ncbi:transcriptional regulator [Kocuria dechangensis]|uniref:Transcriptional regulator n=1 Tax=Kocuria dechangensis TaxID=1176249 RepID=A0A917LZK7_9MICC|nr:ROK family protein [Kocuria dechangensis]GGG69329.1 transcriptional regulator [Kocuria dechangensis]